MKIAEETKKSLHKDGKLLKVNNMNIDFKTQDGVLNAVKDITFDVSRGETVAIVGESGSGKSVSALSILRLLEANGEIASGSILYDQKELRDMSKDEMRKIRGKEIAMIFQDPMSSLDPVYTIGNQLIEAIKIHEELSKQEYIDRAKELLKLVGLPDVDSRMSGYPHQLSGGQKQRVMIAIALACRPDLIIADEPTTALDVTVQAQIMDLLKNLQDEYGTAIILVTHDLAVVAEAADRVVVVYAGQVVEQSEVKTLFNNPEHPYTEGLLRSIPRMDTDRNEMLETIKGSVPTLREIPTGCRFSPRCIYATEKCFAEEPPIFDVTTGHLSRCWINDPESGVKRVPQVMNEEFEDEFAFDPTATQIDHNELLLEVRNVKKHFPITAGLLSRTVGHVKAVNGVSFDLYKGETLGLVGESGCGKSTTARLISSLLDKTDGEVIFGGQELSNLKGKDVKLFRQKMQFIFQDPYNSLNPRMSVLDIISEPLEVHGLAKGNAKVQRVAELLETVGLSRDDISKFPHQFSGGQRQRIGIARALATEPELLICDEAVSALDVSVQAQILNLLRKLQQEMGLSYLFISHDLNVVKYIADRISVMYLGEIMEVADSKSLFKEPLHPYSKALIAAVPDPNPDNTRERVILEGETPSPSNPPSGCLFHTRCPEVMDICKSEKPVMKEVRKDRFVSCHLF